MKIKIDKFIHRSKWRLALMVLPYVILIILAKYVAHVLNLEFLSLNSLFTATICKFYHDLYVDIC